VVKLEHNARIPIPSPPKKRMITIYCGDALRISMPCLIANQGDFKNANDCQPAGSSCFGEQAVLFSESASTTSPKKEHLKLG
jgi:hypothetical protein